MKRIWRVLILTVFALLMMTGISSAAGLSVTKDDILAGVLFCKDYPVSLKVNGEPVVTDVAPVIVKERTLIPARAVFEKMGGKVTWENEQRLVGVSLGKSNVQLSIDSSTALVNGAEKPLEVPALIIDDRTYIPVRFVAESLEWDVDWDDPNRTVVIDRPSDTPIDSPTDDPTDSPTDDEEIVSKEARIQEIVVDEGENSHLIRIQSDGIIEGYKSFAYDNPQRFGIDIKNATLDMESVSLNINNEIFTNIRYSQFEEGVVRVVVDLNEKVAGKVNLSEDEESIVIEFEKGKAEELENLGDTTVDGLDVLDWRATGKLVVIDPGHGGKDSGSQAIRNGETILNEKDVNLDIALRLERMLRAAGVNTLMTREDDTYRGLYERPEIANTAGGDLFVSIHNNSSDRALPNGTEVYYYSKSNQEDYGIDTVKFAKLVQKELTAAIGLNDRGAKSEPAYAVLNKTKMPAIIIEGAFLSNDSDLNYMLTDEFREYYAYATAKAIIQTLNTSIEE